MLRNGIRRIYKLDNEMIAIEFSFVPTLSIIGESIGWYQGHWAKVPRLVVQLTKFITIVIV